jgi:hypothetical protein
MPKESAREKYVTADDLLRGGKKTSIGKEVRAEMCEERRVMVLDEASIRRQQDWALLADVPVGE